MGFLVFQEKQINKSPRFTMLIRLISDQYLKKLNKTYFRGTLTKKQKNHENYGILVGIKY